MIIKQPYLSTTPTGVRIGAEVQVETRRHLSRELWFKVEIMNKQYFDTSFEPFVVGVLMLAMSLGEDIKIKGNLSPKLFYGMRQYQQYFNYWFKEKLKIIDIEAGSYDCDEILGGGNAVASFFSGGVDSFYTLGEHTGEKALGLNKLDYTLFVHGFDIPLEDTSTYNTAFKHYEKMMEQVGIRLIGVKTNLKDLLIHCRAGWGMTHGTALGAVGLLCQNLIGRLYVPSTQKYSVTEPWGSNPIVDPMLSTERLDFIHHGAHVGRLEKISTICDWPITYDALRVCWLRPNGLNNCGRCEKCLRTMMALEIEGRLGNFSTFNSKGTINWSKWKVVDYYEKGYLAELKNKAEIKKRFDLLLIMDNTQKRSNSLKGWYWLRKNLWYKVGYAFLRTRDNWRGTLVKVFGWKNH